MPSPPTSFAHLKRIVPPDVTSDVPSFLPIIPCANSQKGACILVLLSKCKIGGNSKLRLLPCSASAWQAYPNAFQEAQRTSKQSVTHSSPGKWQRKLSCTSQQPHLHPPAGRKKTWLPHCQTPEGIHKLARSAWSKSTGVLWILPDSRRDTQPCKGCYSVAESME